MENFGETALRKTIVKYKKNEGGCRTGRHWSSRVLRLFLLLAALLLIAIAGTNMVVYHTASTHIYTSDFPEPPVDCILVLGAGVTDSKEPSPMLKERLDEAVNLYDKQIAQKIIVSGDHHRTEYDEVNVMKAYLKNAGIPDDAIFMDHAGLSTYDSVYRAKEIFQVKSAAMVTQQYHLYRAVYLARALGIDAYGVPCDRQQFAGSFMRQCREVLARTKDSIIAVYQPEASIMGDAIPVSGSGSQTNDKD